MTFQNKLLFTKMACIACIIIFIIGLVLIFLGNLLTILGIVVLVLALGCGAYFGYLLWSYFQLLRLEDIIKTKKLNEIKDIAREIGKSNNTTTDLIKDCFRNGLLQNFAFFNNEVYPVAKRNSSNSHKVLTNPVVVRCEGCGARFQGFKGEVCDCPYCGTKQVAE